MNEWKRRGGKKRPRSVRCLVEKREREVQKCREGKWMNEKGEGKKKRPRSVRCLVEKRERETERGTKM